MDHSLIAVIGVVGLALLFDYTNGLRLGAGSVIDCRGIPASRAVLQRGGSLDEPEDAARAVPVPAPQPW